MSHAEVAVKPDRLKMFQKGRQNVRIVAREKVMEMRPEKNEARAANRAARRFYGATGFAEPLCHLTDDQGHPHSLIRIRSDAVARPATADHEA